MTKYFVGCSGWTYGSWVSGFYPAALGPQDYLAYYSHVFDFASVSAQAAQSHVLKRWARETPDGFRFVVRVPRQAIDYDLIGQFLEGLAAIEEKVRAVLLLLISIYLSVIVIGSLVFSNDCHRRCNGS